MRASLSIDDDLLNEAKEITGLPETASVEDVIRQFVKDGRRLRAMAELTGIGWDGPHHSRPTFDTLAAEFRALTGGRAHTPSEELMREGRDER